MTKEEFTEAFEEYRRLIWEGAMLVYKLKENQERCAELQAVLEKEVRKQKSGGE